MDKEVLDKTNTIDDIDQVNIAPEDEDEDIDQPPNHVVIRVKETKAYPFLNGRIFETFERMEVIIGSLLLKEAFVITFDETEYIVLEHGASVLSGNPKELPWHVDSPHIMEMGG